MGMNLGSIIPVPDRVSTPAKLFLFAGVLNGFGNGVFGVVIQLYLMSLGFGSVALGTIFMMNSVGMVLLTLPAGILADRYGKGKIVLFGFATTGVAFMILLFSRSIELLSLAFLLLGFGNATGTVWGPLYSSFFDKKDMDKAFGLNGFMNIIAMSIGSLMGFIPPMLVASYGFTLQASYWLLLAVGTGFFFVQMPFFIMSLRGAIEPKSQGGFKFNLRSRSVVAKFCFVTTIGSFGFGIFFSLFPYYVNKKFGVESDALGTLYFFTNFISAAAQAMAPKVSQRQGTLKTIAASIALCAPFYLMIPLAPNFVWLSALYILRRGFKSMADPLTGSLTMKLLYNDEKATANSIITTTNQCSSIAAPWLAGQIMMQMSLDLPAFLGGGLFILQALSTYFLLRDEKEVVEPRVV